MFERKGTYLEASHPADLRTLDVLTSPKNWTSKKFNEVMVALGILGNGQAITAKNRPESIHLEKYRGLFEELLRRTKETGKEHGRTLFVDKGKRSIAMSEKISIGTEREVVMYTTPQPGRDKFQVLVGSVHTHPGTNGVISLEHGFSGQDYKSFLSDSRQQFMIITYGESVRMLVLKTSVTPNNLEPKSVDRRIATTEAEYLDSRNVSIEQVVNFNKMICVEFGLTFYIANKESNDLFSRINVVDVIN